MSKRILVIAHKDLVPPEKIEEEPDRFKTPWITEYDVIKQLKKNGHEVKVCGLLDSLSPLLEEIEQFKPHCVFNLLEEFNYDSRGDYKVLALLELMQIKYTGCNSKGLLLARDKALAKKILKYHKVATPNFFTFPKGKKRKLPKTMKYPMIIKCLFEEASYGIAQASVVHSEEKLLERLNYIHDKLGQDAIVEEFIEGKELYVGIIGHKKLTTLPIWELKFENAENPEKEIYSSRAKWNEKYRDRKGITNGVAKLDKTTENKIIRTCKKVYQVLELSGYARVDLRLTPQNKIYILEVNPNPNVAMDDEFAKSAAYQKISYKELIENVI